MAGVPSTLLNDKSLGNFERKVDTNSPQAAFPILKAKVAQLVDARTHAASWLDFYNTERPHSSLGMLPPDHLQHKQHETIQDGLMIVFAAALLLPPGVLTDALGFTLLIPPGRELIRRLFLSRYLRGTHVQVSTNAQADPMQQSAKPRPSRDPDGTCTIDAQAVRKDP